MANPSIIWLVLLENLIFSSRTARAVQVKQINYGEMIPSLSALDQLKTFFEAGKLRTHVQATYPLSRIIDAFAESATGTVVGKLAVVPDEIPQ